MKTSSWVSGATALTLLLREIVHVGDMRPLWRVADVVVTGFFIVLALTQIKTRPVWLAGIAALVLAIGAISSAYLSCASVTLLWLTHQVHTAQVQQANSDYEKVIRALSHIDEDGQRVT